MSISGLPAKRIFLFIFIICGFYLMRLLLTNEFSKDGIPNDSVGELYLMGLSSSYSRNQTFIITAISSTSEILHSEHPLIIYDYGPCFWIAESGQLGGRTGGEAIWCKSLIGQLTDMGLSVFITNSSMVAKKLSYMTHIRRRNVITIVHWGWQGISKSNWNFRFWKRIVERVPVDSININCLIKMNFWGTKVPTEIWPGSLKRYLTVYPEESLSVGRKITYKEIEKYADYRIRKHDDDVDENNQNTASGLGDQFSKCGSDDKHYHSARILKDTQNVNSKNISAIDMKILNLILNTYESSDVQNVLNNSKNTHIRKNKEKYNHNGNNSYNNDSNIVNMKKNHQFYKKNIAYYIIFGKFGFLVKVDKISKILRNEKLWDGRGPLGSLIGIILNCDDDLFTVLNTTKNRFTCLDNKSIFKTTPYYNLLIKNAVFVLGLGVPILSTTPFEALICNIPVIMPVGQHAFLDYYTSDGTSQFYSFNSTMEFQNNVRDVLTDFRRKKGMY